MPAATEHRYLLAVDVPPTEAGKLRDALEGESLGLADRFGAAWLAAQIDAARIEVDTRAPSQWHDFAHDLEVLSLYLTPPVVGHEVEVGGGAVRAWRVSARRGEVVRVALHAHLDDDGDVVLGEPDLRDAKRRWHTFPDWIQSWLRGVHPELRDA